MANKQILALWNRMSHTSPPSSDPALSDCLEAQPKISAAIGQHVTAESENKNKISLDLGSLVSFLSLCLNILFGYGLTLSGNHHDGPGEPGPFPVPWPGSRHIGR